MTKGSCLCTAIQFEIDDAGVAFATGCYCTNCRKASGGQHTVYLQVRRNAFRWLSDRTTARSFESSPGNKRGFCGVCGATVPIETNYGAVRVPAGALDSDPGAALTVNIYTQSKAAWCSAENPGLTFADVGPQAFWTEMITRLYAPK